MEKWHSKWGDRLIELVFIGQNLDKEQITADLNNCLLTENEIVAMGSGGQFIDNWPI